jgi:hypothetical protein
MPDMTQVTELRGSVLGKGYRLGQTVGDARDHLHEARHERIPGRFFIRVFPVESLARPEAAARIQRAARVASLLRDVHVVQILDFSVSGELPAFVVMQRIDADPLWLAMAQVGSLPLPRGVEIVESVAEALATGPRLGLVHGDLRPELVLLPSTGAPAAQVSGFGWSKEFRLASAVPQSAAYLAPEQLVGSATPIDERADQFALGAIAYELLGGKLPFSIDPSTRAALLADAPAPPPLAGSVDGISRAVDEVLRRALSFRPGERFASVRAFAAELKLAAQAASEAVRGEVIALAPESPEPREEPLVVDRAQARADDQVENQVDDQREDRRNDEAAGESVTASPRADGALEPGQAEELAAGQADGVLEPGPAAPEAEIELDGSEDEDLALGATHGVAADEGKTQVTRSPFFEAGDGEDEPSREDADLDVDDIRYDDNRDRREEAHADGDPLPFVRAHGQTLAHAGRPGRPLSPGSASSRHTLTYGTVFAPPGGAEGGGEDEERWGELSGSDELPTASDDSDPADLASENTQPDGKPFPVHGAGRQVAAAWLGRLQKQPHWVVGSVAGLVFLIGLSILLARGPVTHATSAVPGPVAIRSPEPRHEPEVEPIRVEPILLPTGAPGSTSEPAPAPAAVGTKAGATVIEALHSPQAAGCLLSVSAHPGAEIWLDQQDSGRKSPTAALNLSCGIHELALRRPDGSVAELESIALKPGQPALQR